MCSIAAVCIVSPQNDLRRWSVVREKYDGRRVGTGWVDSTAQR